MTTLPLPALRRRPRSRALVTALSHPAAWLVAIVSVSSIARIAAAWQHTSPRTFPDEYIYPALARSHRVR